MKILLTGACGFVGSSLARALLRLRPGLEIVGMDNFIRPGSETNRADLRSMGVPLLHGDVRAVSDLETLPSVDWIIDAAANPSVLAGVDGRSSSRQVLEHNLTSTINLLELARKHEAGFLLLSTSRLYSIREIAALPLATVRDRFQLSVDGKLPPGVSAKGIAESFSVAAPISLYGASKLASEVLALEYAETFGLPVWINRCGVIAGAGQFGRADQGIVAYWINAYLRRQALHYIGFNGQGQQVRDALHPRDLATIVAKQLDAKAANERPRTINLGGGDANAFSLAELSAWCRQRFGFEAKIASDPNPRPLDLPWVVMDSSLAQQTWAWSPTVGLQKIFEEVAQHAEAHPDWLEMSR